tara:strand:+ start:339 stop:857 length:519 start_codon:yes stop_codon:yes gene_type:complete
MQVKIDEGKHRKFNASINFLKKEANWNKMVWVAMNNVADNIRDDAEKKLYSKWKRRTGQAGEDIKSVIKRDGNYTYISLTSKHPAARLMEYGGPSPMPSAPSRTHEGNPAIRDYAYIYESTNSSDPFFELARGIYKNQPFKHGTFHMQRALREGLPKLESEIMKTYYRMKPK